LLVVLVQLKELRREREERVGGDGRRRRSGSGLVEGIAQFVEAVLGPLLLALAVARRHEALVQPVHHVHGHLVLLGRAAADWDVVLEEGLEEGARNLGPLHLQVRRAQALVSFEQARGLNFVSRFLCKNGCHIGGHPLLFLVAQLADVVAAAAHLHGDHYPRRLQ
jgi:hypothetical protein